jgi:putative DNA primase/helicase
VLSAVSLSNMARVVLPPAVRTVILCADNDGDNAGAARALQRAVDHFAAEGRNVKIALPPIGKDFNDTLQQVDA